MSAEFGDPRLPERFWSKVEVDAETGCWLWTAALRSGYGAFRVGGKTCLTHRISYGVFVEGECPSTLDHECRIRNCVNPKHLRPATRSQNTRHKESLEGSSSRFLGVSWNKRESKWWSSMRVDGKLQYLGCFENEEDAARAYDAAAVQFGVAEFVIFNFPDDSDEAREKFKYVKPTWTSRFRGVSWCKSANKWRAAIQADGKKLHLGHFGNEEDAARTYDAAAVQFGVTEFAILNFPDDSNEVREKYKYVKPTLASRFRGVTRNKYTSKWKVQIMVDGKQKYLGYFHDEEEAARAYDAAAVQYGRKLNFPEEHTNEQDE